MVRGLQRPILTVVGLAAAVCTYESLRSAGVLPGYLPDLELNSKEPFTLTAFALSLLLVFRTNSSYSRCARLGGGAGGSCTSDPEDACACPRAAPPPPPPGSQLWP